MNLSRETDRRVATFALAWWVLGGARSLYSIFVLHSPPPKPVTAEGVFWFLLVAAIQVLILVGIARANRVALWLFSAGNLLGPVLSTWVQIARHWPISAWWIIGCMVDLFLGAYCVARLISLARGKAFVIVPPK